MQNPDNHLGTQTSPYLLQHADNPVNWYPWSQEALALAKQQNKPILLSIGYSACHWCHVMAHESFEDPATASIMNQLFINIKVDREERPDLDKIYQSAHSMLTGRPGGWPLTVFLTPDDQMPFFAGTYFPPVTRYNMPGFQDLLQKIQDIFVNRQPDILEQNQSLKQMLDQMTQSAAQVDLSPLSFDLARKQILSEFDPQQGGYSKAPKFPHPSMIEYSLRHAWKTGFSDEEIDHAALFTLDRMALGGIFDHLAGGFCRYSTDDLWMIPHFEKMLYDNGQLLPLYVAAWQRKPNYLYQDTIRKTVSWVIEEMQSPDGGYYSAQDADSEGEEGKYYVWRPEQVKALLSEQEYPVFAHAYGLDRDSNFEGQWHLHTYASLAELAITFGQEEAKVHALLESSRVKLLAARKQRIAPGTDDKILTSWNALMIQAMSRTGRILDSDECIASAERALQFVHQQLWDGQQLLATCKNGKAHINAYLDDYAFLLAAILEHLQTRWDNQMFAWATQIADTLLEQFEDKSSGGFYFTSHNHENLIQRPRNFTDEATPSGNGIAATALQRLGILCGNSEYLRATEACLKAASQHLQQHPVMCCSLLTALDELLTSTVIIVLRGETETMRTWQQEIDKHYQPDILCFALETHMRPPETLADKKPQETLCAYICEGTHCLAPVMQLEDLQSYLHRRHSDIS